MTFKEKVEAYIHEELGYSREEYRVDTVIPHNTWTYADVSRSRPGTDARTHAAHQFVVPFGV